MKKIALFLAVVCLAAIFSTVAFAAEDFVMFDFRTEDAIKEMASMSTSGIGDKQFIDGAYEVVTTSGDPYVNLSIKTKYRFEASDYPVIRLEYKVIDGAPTQGQFFFATNTDGFSMGNAGTYAQYPIDITTMDWQTNVIDLELISSSQWADTVKTARLDITTSPDCTIAIRSVGFFRSEKDAYAFDYDAWAEENPPFTKDAAAETETTAPAETETTAPAETETTAPAETETTAPAETAPETADPFTAVAVVMALSAGAALAIKKRR